MIKITNKNEALVYLNLLLEDLVLLQNGEWVPDHDSCEVSMTALEAVIDFFKGTK